MHLIKHFSRGKNYNRFEASEKLYTTPAISDGSKLS